MVKDNQKMVMLKNKDVSPTRLRMLTLTQLRAARAIVGWTRADLRKRSSVAVPTITGFELQGAAPKSVRYKSCGVRRRLPGLSS